MNFSALLSKIDEFAWGPWLLVIMVGTGIYLTVRTKFLQFDKFGYAMKNTLGKITSKQKAGIGEITPFQAVTTALAGTVGVGSVAGATGAIAIGGPGAVFWMWVSALFGMVTKYFEVTLAVRFRERNEKGEWAGGPMYYIKNGLGKKWNFLAVLFCIFGGLACIGTGGMTQINSIAASVNTFIDSLSEGFTKAHTVSFMGQKAPVVSIIIGASIAVLVAVILLGGVKRIGSVTEKLVPFMAVVYVAACIIVVVGNANIIGEVFRWIFVCAFKPKSVMGGAVGSTMMIAMSKGIGRGVFSNEAGLGSAPMAHATTSEKNPVKQGLFGIFEVFMATFVICTLTALVVLSGIYRLYGKGVRFSWGKNAGTELVSRAFGTVIGDRLGSAVVAVGIALFALSTILGWALYGSRCWGFLFGKKAETAFYVVFVAGIFFGSFLKLDVVWTISDIFNAFMALPNLIAVLALSPVVIRLTKDHFSPSSSADAAVQSRRKAG